MKQICPAPWTAVDATNNNYRPCCLFDFKQWDSSETVDQYWNSPGLQQLRQDLLDGNRPKGCQKCWDLEDQNIRSMRQNLLKEYPAWKPFPKLERVKINTGDTCNISCMMCFDTVSSTYRQFWKDKTFPIMPVNKRPVLNYDENMHSWIEQNHQQLRYIEILGGESLFSKRFLELIDYLVDVGSANRITLYLITNATICTARIIEKLKKFKKVVIIASVDGIGAVNEYQRWGTEWKSIESNIDVFMQHFDVCLNTTVTALNVSRLSEIDDWAKSRHISMISHSVVSGWPDLLPGNCPQELHARIDKKYQNFLNFQQPGHKLFDFINEWDQARGISIVDYMPEWQGLLTGLNQS